MVIDPDDPAADKVLAATSNGIWVRSAGGIWTQATTGFDNPNGVATDVVVVGSTATGNKLYYAAFGGNRVYSSANGTLWAPVTGITAAAGRLVLGASESDITVYAYRADGNCWRLVSGAFVPVTGAPTDDLGGNWYHMVLAVDPTDPNVIYIGGLWVYRATVQHMGSWSMTPSVYYSVHSDAHAVAFALNAGSVTHNPDDVWIGVDGGVYRSTSPTSQTSMIPQNVGLAITQPYCLATRADMDGIALIGTQDLGVHLYFGEAAWIQTQDNGGDGGGIAIDPNNPYRMLKAINGHLWVSVDGGTGPNSSWAQVVAFPGDAEPKAWAPPIKTTPPGVLPTLAFFGTTRLWMTPDWGGSWVTLPSNISPGGNGALDVIDNSAIIAISAASATRVYVCTNANIRRYDGPGTPWAMTSIPVAGLPAVYYLTALAPETGNAFYAAIGGSSAGHLYYYDGSAWHEAMPASVVNSPAHAVVVDPSSPTTVYVGTDVGVWKGLRSGTPTSPSWTWNVFSYGLPESSVNDMLLHNPARILRVATHGRGVWEVALETPAASNVADLYLRVDYADSGRIRTGGQRSAYVDAGLPDPYKPPPNPGKLYHWKSPDIKVRRSSLKAPLAAPVDYLDFATHIDDYVDSILDAETADQAGVNQLFIEVHNRAVTTPAVQVSVLALMTDASLALPPLPAGWADQINTLHPDPANPANWLAGSDWHFVDSGTPYRAISSPLDVRNPAVVTYDNLTFGALGLPSGHDHVCIAAFVTAPTNAIPATAETSLDMIAMSDKHVAHRNLHVVPAGATPLPPPASNAFEQTWQLITVDARNPLAEPIVVNVVFERVLFPGAIAVALPRAHKQFDGFKLHPVKKVESDLRAVYRDWFKARDELIRHPPHRLVPRLAKKVERLARLDGTHILVAEDHKTLGLHALRLEPGEAVPLLIALRAPNDARPGDRFYIDVVERYRDRILGGSSYVLAVVPTK